MEIAFPFSISQHGRVASATYEEHIYQLIYQLLFTNIGERVNRPTFGCSVVQLVFSLGSTELVTATQALVHAALEQWLGNLIKVEAVQVQMNDSVLTISVQYIILRTQQRKVSQFTRQS
jgi:hypothetical protein